MNKDEFIKQVQAMTDIGDRREAEEAARIVLSIFSHRLHPDESQDVEAQLPEPLKKLWTSDTWITNYIEITGKNMIKFRHKAEFLSLIENELEKKQIGVPAERLAVCVLHLLKEQVGQGEADDVAGQLPAELREFWTAA